MIYYPLQMLKLSGIDDIIIVVNDGCQGEQIAKIIECGSYLRFSSIKYVFQDKPKGTAYAISLCKKLLDTSSFVVAWGDNIFEYCPLGLTKDINQEAIIFVKEVDNISHYGKVILNDGRGVVDIQYYSSSDSENNRGYALAGIFMLPWYFCDYIDKIIPNFKNEIDIVDALREYIKANKIKANIIKGYWVDAASSFDNLLEASILVKNNGVNKVIE